MQDGERAALQPRERFDPYVLVNRHPGIAGFETNVIPSTHASRGGQR